MTGYGPDSGKQSIKDIIKEGIQEAKREEQPDDVATTGVEKPTNIAERYPSAIPEKPKLGGTRKSFHPTARKLQETALPPQLQKQTGPVFSEVSHPAVKHQLKKQAEQMMKEDTGSGGIRPEPGESLIEFNKRLEGMNLTEEQIKGIISNSDFADQLVTDAQIEYAQAIDAINQKIQEGIDLKNADLEADKALIESRELFFERMGEITDFAMEKSRESA